MALDMQHPEDSDFDDNTLARFEKGSARERDIIATLSRLGQLTTPRFDIISGQESKQITDRDGTHLMTGRIDGRLKFEGGDKVIFEVKSGESVRGVTDIAGLDRSPWGTKYIDQLLAYLYADNLETGLFVLDQPGIPTLIPLHLGEYLDRMEQFLKDAREAVDSVELQLLPDFINDRAECKRCPHFGKSCAPPMDYGAGVQILTDPELIAALEIRERTKDAAIEYEAADKAVKERCRGMEMAIAGDFQITGKWSPLTTYSVPKEVKEQYKTLNPQGAWRIKIDRI
jgi:hypothetical protein